MHCNFICGLSDVIIKTFSQSVSHYASVTEQYNLTSLLAKGQCYPVAKKLTAGMTKMTTAYTGHSTA